MMEIYTGDTPLVLSRLVTATCMFLAFLCDASLSQYFTENPSLRHRTCRPGDLLATLAADTTVSCLHGCTRRHSAYSVFYRHAAATCFCCADIYVASDGLPTETGTAYYSTNVTNDSTSGYSDCLSLQSTGVTTSGVYNVVTPVTRTSLDVYCDMDIHGGGWIVFQNRYNGLVDFYRNFSQYEDGFGDVNGEFWLGLRYMREFTALRPASLYLHFVDANDVTAFELFDGAWVSGAPNYTMHTGTPVDANDGTFPPDTGVGFDWADGVAFSASDVDNDPSSNRHCAEKRHSGWWHEGCTKINANGKYLTPGTVGNVTTMSHTTWRGGKVALKATRLMLRRGSP